MDMRTASLAAVRRSKYSNYWNVNWPSLLEINDWGRESWIRSSPLMKLVINVDNQHR